MSQNRPPRASKVSATPTVVHTRPEQIEASFPRLRLVSVDTTTSEKTGDTPRSSAFSGLNRRKHHRFGLVRSSKVFRRASNTFVPAVTVNLSVGGALIETAAARPFEVGEIIDLGVAFRGVAAVEQASMQQAIVVRAASIDDRRQTVAVRYLNPHHADRKAA